MSFESLAYRHCFKIESFPQRWLPLIHLYDPDLPLFPIYYFHVLNENVEPGEIPSKFERAYGYVEKVNYLNDRKLQVTVVTNKNLKSDHNKSYLNPVKNEIYERFGINNPVTLDDVKNTFEHPLDYANNILARIWERSVHNSMGQRLPFGRLWDQVIGLTRWVSSWYSPSGRKGELIQTHYFASVFGERIQSSGNIPQVDFFLLPTYQELINLNNSLEIFPEYKKLINLADAFNKIYCSHIDIDDIELSSFSNPFSGNLNKDKTIRLMQDPNIPYNYRNSGKECFNAFDKGPQRTVIFLMMLDDIRKRRLRPNTLTKTQCGLIYDILDRRSTYQSPKAIEIYAQQCFGNTSSMPIDNWISTVFKWPLNVYPSGRSKNKHKYIFEHSNNLGKVERLLWFASQARKVHSSACNDALWCLKYGSKSNPRGANPLSCNICIFSSGIDCPAYNKIKDKIIVFNNKTQKIEPDFIITTSRNNNNSPNQEFTKCKGKSIYADILDDFSPVDEPSGFALYPNPPHQGEELTVKEFIDIYKN